MHPAITAKRLTAWLAVVALLLFNAFGPLRAHAGRGSIERLAAAVDICSAASVVGSASRIGQHASLASHGDGSGRDDAGARAGHCALCLGQAAPPVIPRIGPLRFLAPAASPGWSQAADPRLRASRSHARAQPRAPPRQA